jgi:hypothetical protein
MSPASSLASHYRVDAYRGFGCLFPGNVACELFSHPASRRHSLGAYHERLARPSHNGQGATGNGPTCEFPKNRTRHSHPTRRSLRCQFELLNTYYLMCGFARRPLRHALHPNCLGRTFRLTGRAPLPTPHGNVKRFPRFCSDKRRTDKRKAGPACRAEKSVTTEQPTAITRLATNVCLRVGPQMCGLEVIGRNFL